MERSPLNIKRSYLRLSRAVWNNFSFELNSVEQVSMNQIAIEAQIGPGTLYRRYRNKGELCLDLIKDNIDLLFEDIEMLSRINILDSREKLYLH
ncbi:MAG: TetR/AcrR family transcriptional regulator [Desulfosporosinus sp.]|nr:TetR/AcrR family transcriptional regulator [Desulfosporosinus sp.]